MGIIDDDNDDEIEKYSCEQMKSEMLFKKLHD